MRGEALSRTEKRRNKFRNKVWISGSSDSLGRCNTTRQRRHVLLLAIDRLPPHCLRAVYRDGRRREIKKIQLTAVLMMSALEILLLD